MPRRRFKGNYSRTRVFLILGGLISILLGCLLWRGVWNLEQVFAILLFIAGAFKILVGLLKK